MDMEYEKSIASEDKDQSNENYNITNETEKSAGPEESPETEKTGMAEKPVVVSASHISMRFKMSSEKFDSFKEYVIKSIKNQVSSESFWALRDVSFEVRQGDSLGLIGFNGSGKSTMLKIIAGVLKPSDGQIMVRGKVAPLIELGAGFDMDLTARENVFLNGALLGYSRKEMNSYYDEIVEFSELEAFMDIPVKNYSSGMIARLAFAIATIGIPDILICDEVLAVGDYRFQEKCENRIQNMVEKGTTILFVSHSIDQVKKVCDKILWLEHGTVRKYGDSETICEEYRNQ